MVDLIRNYKTVAFYPPRRSGVKGEVEKAIKGVNDLCGRTGNAVRLELWDTSKLVPDSFDQIILIEEQLKPADSHILLVILGQDWNSELDLVKQVMVERYQSQKRFPRTMLYRLQVNDLGVKADDEIRSYAKVLDFLADCSPEGKHPAYVVTLDQADLVNRLVTDLFSRVQDFDRDSGQGESVDSPKRGPLPTGSGQTKDYAETKPIHNRYALIVGVNRFIDPGLKKLNFCVNDAVGLEEMLKRAGYSTRCMWDDSPDTSLRPTFFNVDAEIRNIMAVAEEDDLIWVHFSCHGKLDQGKPVLIVVDTRLANIEKSGIFVSDLIGQLRSAKCRRLIVTLDACHAGIDMGRDVSNADFIRYANELAEGMAIISASTADQAAFEKKDISHGLFTYFLLEGLEGKADRQNKGFVTANDIASYTLVQLRKWRFDHGDVIQDPNARIEALGDMILADWRNGK